MAVSISAVLIPCLKSFNQLLERVERPDYAHEHEVSSTLWADELGRLRIWAANIGAHQTGQSSLDFRLRDASHISRQITKLLRDLHQSIGDTETVLSEDKSSISAIGSPTDISPEDGSTTELQEVHEEIVTIVNCLFKLSMLIRRPVHHDVLLGSHTSDTAAFEPFDKEHVRNKYPNANVDIIQRLGRGITRRRKYLKYRERHHAKLGEGIEEVQGIQRATTDSVMSKTIATDFDPQHIDFEETPSNSGLSQTSYSPSLVDGGAITIPPAPRESGAGKPFECPYCFFIISTQSTRSWTKHIFKDIKPYTCSLPSCSIPDKMYDSRREWFSHETTAHRRESFICTLCKNTLISPKQYERHVARHLEEVALFALPRNEIDNGGEGESDNVGSNPDTDTSGSQEKFDPGLAVYSRLPHDDELYVMRAFARHSSHCVQCDHPLEVYRRGRTLCPKGHQRAVDLAQYLYNKEGCTYSVVDLEKNMRVQVEIPAGCELVRELLQAMDNGLRLHGRKTLNSLR